MQQLNWTIDLGAWHKELAATAFAKQMFERLRQMDNPDRAELLTRLRGMGHSGMWWNPPGDTAKEVGLRDRGIGYPWAPDVRGDPPGGPDRDERFQ